MLAVYLISGMTGLNERSETRSLSTTELLLPTVGSMLVVAARGVVLALRPRQLWLPNP